VKPSDLRFILEQMTPREQLFASALGEVIESVFSYAKGEISEDYLHAQVRAVFIGVSDATEMNSEDLTWLLLFLAAGAQTSVAFRPAAAARPPAGRGASAGGEPNSPEPPAEGPVQPSSPLAEAFIREVAYREAFGLPPMSKSQEPPVTPQQWPTDEDELPIDPATID
jgi:hypothetical protein